MLFLLETLYSLHIILERFMVESKKPLETALNEVVMIKFSEPSERELIRLRIEDTFDVKL